MKNKNKFKDTIAGIGKNSKAPLLAFGDDSLYNEIIVYGFVIFQRTQFKKIKEDILKLKGEFGIPEHIPIHLKNLLSGYYRKKYQISNLERENQPAFFERVIDIINSNGCVVRYSYAIIPESGRIYPENSPNEEIPIVDNHKAIVHQFAAMCFTPYEYNGKVIFTASDFEIFISKELTPVKFFQNGQKKKAQFMCEALVPKSLPVKKGKYWRLKPHYVAMKDSILLQFADAVVYLLSHALSKNCTDSFYKREKDRIVHWIEHPLETEV